MLKISTLQTNFKSEDSSVRLHSAMMAGTFPSPEFIDLLFSQCAVEQDFFVRDMLSWALIQNNKEQVISKLIPQLDSEITQARSQALHTLSKLGEKSLYPHIKSRHISDPSDEVAKTAWRTAVMLVSDTDVKPLIDKLIEQLGRGDFETKLSLSRSLCALGENIKESIYLKMDDAAENVSSHATFTLKLLEKPELEREFTLEFARKIDSLNGAPLTPASELKNY